MLRDATRAHIGSFDTMIAGGLRRAVAVSILLLLVTLLANHQEVPITLSKTCTCWLTCYIRSVNLNDLMLLLGQGFTVKSLVPFCSLYQMSYV